MTRLRRREAPIDYTDLMSPAAAPLRGRTKAKGLRGGGDSDGDDDDDGNDGNGGGRGGGRGGPRASSSAEAARKKKTAQKTTTTTEKKETKAKAKKKETKSRARKTPTAAKEEDAEEAAAEGRTAGDAPEVAEADGPRGLDLANVDTRRRQKRPKRRDDDNDGDADDGPHNAIDGRESADGVDDDTVATSPPRTARDNKRRATTESAGTDAKRPKATISGGPESVQQAAEAELASLRQKYRALQEFRETETERLLQQAKALANEEKRTYDKLVAKLKREIEELSTQAQEAASESKRRVNELQTAHDLRTEDWRRERQAASDECERLRKRVRALETELAVSNGPTNAPRDVITSSTAAVARGNDNVELVQARKLLNAYRLVTSMDIRLIETLDDDEDDEDNGGDACTDVACAVVESATGKRLEFDLALPHAPEDEIEYVPSDRPSREFKVPSYLQEELSFKRSELTKFFRTVLDVVIRKKREANAAVKDKAAATATR